jgi:hypothetical protein
MIAKRPNKKHERKKKSCHQLDNIQQIERQNSPILTVGAFSLQKFLALATVALLFVFAN